MSYSKILERRRICQIHPRPFEYIVCRGTKNRTAKVDVDVHNKKRRWTNYVTRLWALAKKERAASDWPPPSFSA